MDKDALQSSQPFPWSGLQFVMRGGAAARKAISRAGSLRYAAPGNPIKVLEPAFTLAGTAESRRRDRPGGHRADLQRCGGGAAIAHPGPARRAADHRHARIGKGGIMADADTTQAYSLLPWVRRGIASRISGTPTVNYATVPVSLSVNGAQVPAPPKVRLPGPGDVKTIDARAFIRTDPVDGADSFEPNYLAIVELATPDLPWLHTPAGNNGGRLQPWICLIVIPDGDGVTLTPQAGGPALLRIDSPLDPAAELPDLTQTDVWAHVQIAGSDLSTAALSGDSGATLSRLVSPRALVANQRYLACVVPTYHAGVNAGLGLTVDDSDLGLAWAKNVTAPFTLPVYFSFRFQTGPNGDLASLARKIGPPTSPIIIGSRPTDFSQPGFGAADALGVTLGLEGALRSFNMADTPWPVGAQAAYEAQLRAVLSPPAAADPVVTPPLYGRTQSGAALPADSAQPLWLGELNLDPRNRTAAALGGQVVQAGADAMVASAWSQIGEIRKANQLLRQSQLAREVSNSLSRRHLQTVSGDGVYLQITSPTHRRVSVALSGSALTLAGHMAASRIPDTAVSAAMRRLARPRGPIGRQLAAATAPQQIVDRLNIPPAATPSSTGPSGIVAAGPVKAPAGMVALDSVSPTIQVAEMTTTALASAPGWLKTTAPLVINLKPVQPVTCRAPDPPVGPVAPRPPAPPPAATSGPPADHELEGRCQYPRPPAKRRGDHARALRLPRDCRRSRNLAGQFQHCRHIHQRLHRHR